MEKHSKWSTVNPRGSPAFWRKVEQDWIVPVERTVVEQPVVRTPMAVQEYRTKEDLDIKLAELKVTLYDDEDGHIENSGKWPLLIDETGTVGTFLKYGDTIMIDAVGKGALEPEMLRLHLLRAVRYGKALVLDLTEVDSSTMWGIFKERLEEVEAGLFECVMGKMLTKEDKYQTLMREGDESSLLHVRDFWDTQDLFRLWVLVKGEVEQGMADTMFTIRVCQQ